MHEIRRKTIPSSIRLLLFRLLNIVEVSYFQSCTDSSSLFCTWCYQGQTANCFPIQVRYISTKTKRHLEKMIQSVFEWDLSSESLQPRPVPSIPFPHGAHQLDSLIRQNNVIASSLNGLPPVVTFLAQDMQWLNAQRVTQDSNRVENIGELQRRIGPIQEGLIRSRVALRLGLQWTEALEVNNLNDILYFVGTGLGAAREERIAAKRRILTALVGRESLIDKKHLIEFEAFEIGDFLKVRHCQRELSDHKAVSCCTPHCLVRRGEKSQQLSWP
jgi:hypothetical protein